MFQPDSKRNKDFTHKTPIFNNYKLKDQEDDNGLILNNDAEIRLEDLSFIVDDILSRKCEENVNSNNNENTVSSFRLFLMLILIDSVLITSRR